MKVSVLMISLNQAAYLPEAIKSVLTQSYSDLELIVSDPGSGDGSRDILMDAAREDDRVRLLFQKDSGPADGLNGAASRAQGEVMGCLNADDYYLDGSLQFVADEFYRSPEVGILIGSGYRKENVGAFKPVISDKFSPRRYVSGLSLALQQATFFRTEAVRTAGIRFNPANRTCWDGEFLVDLTLRGAVSKTISRPLGVFRIHEASITGTGRLQDKYMLDQQRIAEKVLGRPQYPIERKAAGLLGKFQAFRRLPRILVMESQHSRKSN